MRSERAFTLVETVMTLLLLGILATVAIPNFFDMRDDARSAVTRDEMAALRRAIVGDSRVVAGGRFAFPGFEADMARLPANLGELVLNPSTGDKTQDYNPLTRRGWRGPYVDDSAVGDYSTDAWGTAYVYSAASRLIRSWGPNKTDDSGGNDDIDITF